MTWLGTSSGSPSNERNVSCTVVQTPNASFLVDCGEGSQRQLLQANIDPSQIDGIFITHLHGDHCFGLATTLIMIDSAKAERWEREGADLEASGLQKDERNKGGRGVQASYGPGGTAASRGPIT